MGNLIQAVKTHVPCAGPRYRRRLLVRTPEVVAEAFAPPTDIWEVVSESGQEQLWLRLYPDPYTQDNQVYGESAELEPSFAQVSLYNPTTCRRGFKARITDSRAIFADLLAYLAQLSRSSGYGTLSPVAVLDFCRPEIADRLTAVTTGQEAYTLRLGSLRVSSLPPTVGTSPETLEDAWEFEFAETNTLRLL